MISTATEDAFADWIISSLADRAADGECGGSIREIAGRDARAGVRNPDMPPLEDIAVALSASGRGAQGAGGEEQKRLAAQAYASVCREIAGGAYSAE